MPSRHCKQALRQSTSPRSGPGSSWVIATTRKGRFLEAAGDFAACAVRGPKFAWVHFNRGLALARAGRPLEARYAYDRALELDPAFCRGTGQPRHGRARARTSSHAAQRDLVRSIELGRDDLVAMTSLGETLARMGRRDEAERYFAGLLAQNPGSLVVRVARGFTRIAADPAGARSDLALALDQDPRHAHAHYGMALLMRGHDLREALEHLDGALQSDPNLIDAVQLRALVRARLGEPSRPRRRRAPPGKPHPSSSLQCRLRGRRLLGEGQGAPVRCPRAGTSGPRGRRRLPPSEAAADPDLAACANLPISPGPWQENILASILAKNLTTLPRLNYVCSRRAREHPPTLTDSRISNDMQVMNTALKTTQVPARTYPAQSSSLDKGVEPCPSFN